VIRFWVPDAGGFTRLAEKSGNGGGSDTAGPAHKDMAQIAIMLNRFMLRILLDTCFSLFIAQSTAQIHFVSKLAPI